MNAPAAAEKRPPSVLSAAGQENDLSDFTSANARNALELESARVLSAAAQASSKPRHTQTDPLPRVGNNCIVGGIVT